MLKVMKVTEGPLHPLQQFPMCMVCHGDALSNLDYLNGTDEHIHRKCLIETHKSGTGDYHEELRVETAKHEWGTSCQSVQITINELRQLFEVVSDSLEPHLLPIILNSDTANHDSVSVLILGGNNQVLANFKESSSGELFLKLTTWEVLNSGANGTNGELLLTGVKDNEREPWHTVNNEWSNLRSLLGLYLNQYERGYRTTDFNLDLTKAHQFEISFE